MTSLDTRDDRKDGDDDDDDPKETAYIIVVYAIGDPIASYLPLFIITFYVYRCIHIKLGINIRDNHFSTTFIAILLFAMRPSL